MTMSKPEPLLSIIIPFFNNEEFITPCLESLFRQIADDIEIILIDDGSTDKSGELVRLFLENHHHTNTRLITQSNHGIAFTRNVGLDNANGQYITFLDGDDILSRHYMKTIRPCLESGEFDLIDFDYEKFTSQPCESDIAEDTPCVRYNFEQKGLNCLEILFERSMWHLWNRIYKRNILENERFEVGRRYEDVIFAPFIYFKTTRIGRINQKLYFYRDNYFGITRNIKKQDIEDMLFAIKKMILAAEKQPDNQELRGLAARMIVNCFGEVKNMSKALYGYYYYHKDTIVTLRAAANICSGTAVSTKTVCQMRYPQIDTLFSKVRLTLKKISGTYSHKS